MILTAILSIIYVAILGITAPLRGLPNVAVPANVSTAITNASGYLTSFNFVLPVTTLVIIIGAVLIYETAVFSYKGIMWIIKRFPTQS